jgi:hypothetical protein
MVQRIRSFILAAMMIAAGNAVAQELSDVGRLEILNQEMRQVKQRITALVAISPWSREHVDQYRRHLQDFESLQREIARIKTLAPRLLSNSGGTAPNVATSPGPVVSKAPTTASAQVRNGRTSGIWEDGNANAQ